MNTPAFLSEHAQKIVMEGLLFPKSSEELFRFVGWAQQRAHERLTLLVAQSKESRTFSSTVMLFDQALTEYRQLECLCEAYALVCPEDQLRNACLQAHQDLQKAAFDIFYTQELYQSFKEYNDLVQEKKIVLTKEQAYLLQEFMREFKHEGLDRDPAVFKQVQQIKKELCAQVLVFDALIAEDNRFLTCHKTEFTGLSDDFIAQLQGDAQGQVKVGIDYPTYLEVMGHCSNEQLRRRLYRLFHNRAYPKNYDTLEAMIVLRDRLAHTLGYESFAAYDLEHCMAKSVEHVQAFLDDLAARATKKYEQEFAELTRWLPEGVSLTDEGQLAPWNLSYVAKQYKKKQYALDDRLVAEYFPVQKVLEGVFALYADFLGLSFSLVKPDWSWHEDVLVIEARTKQDNSLRGYVYLDLYPRDNKYSHACHAGIIPTVYDEQGKPTPSIALVVANFPRATTDRPALLKFADVETFLHEFGHAMHFLLGTTAAGSTSGTAVKIDFVEMPSQMFEEWMYEPSVLKLMSGHYQTGEVLPNELIEKLIRIKQFDAGFFVMRQIALARLSLNLFGPGSKKNITAQQKKLFTELLPQIAYDDDNHFAASFGHLGNYSARYYCYLWSKVYALDLFSLIKKMGATEYATGKVFIEKILSRGGSLDPNDLLREFLGRAPTSDAFFKDMGIE